jgi:hypothetical protein
MPKGLSKNELIQDQYASSSLERRYELRDPIPRTWVIETTAIYYLQELEKGNISILQDFHVGSKDSSANMISSDVVITTNCDALMCHLFGNMII